MNRPVPISRRAYQPAPLTPDELSAMIVRFCMWFMIIGGVALCLIGKFG